MALLTLTEEYNSRLNNFAYDVNEHLELIKTYASQCPTVVELGLSNPAALFAFMMGNSKTITSYDSVSIEEKGIDRNALIEFAAANGITYSFVDQDPATAPIDPTDLLFMHYIATPSDVAQGLASFASKTAKFIIIPLFSVDNDGCMQAINDFITANPSWKIAENIDAWCKLVVLSL